MNRHIVQEDSGAEGRTGFEPEVYGASDTGAGLVIYGVHGRGQSPTFIRELADRVGQLERFRWIMPSAPGNSWHPAGFMAPFDENQPFLDNALQTVDRHLKGLLAGPLPVVTLGFSQGACLLAEHLLTKQPAVDGIILHTGVISDPKGGLSGWERDMPARGRVLTARADPWVPLHRSEETAQELTAVGADVTVTIYEDTEHHINDDAVDRIRQLLEQVADSYLARANSR